MIRLLFLLSFFLLMGCTTIKEPMEIEESTFNQRRAASDANVKLAIAFLKQGYVNDSKKKLLLAQILDPKNPSAWYGFGYFYESISEIKEAKENYERAIEIAPKSGAAHNNYGTFLYRVGNYREAVRHFLMAINDPQYLDTASAYENAGFSALKIPDKNLAKYYFQKAISQDGNLVTSANYLAELPTR